MDSTLNVYQIRPCIQGLVKRDAYHLVCDIVCLRESGIGLIHHDEEWREPGVMPERETRLIGFFLDDEKLEALRRFMALSHYEREDRLNIFRRKWGTHLDPNWNGPALPAGLLLRSEGVYHFLHASNNKWTRPYRRCLEIPTFCEVDSSPSSNLCQDLPARTEALRYLLQGEECARDVLPPEIEDGLVGRTVIFKMYKDGWIKGKIHRIISVEERRRRFDTQNVVLTLSKHRVEAITLSPATYFDATTSLT